MHNSLIKVMILCGAIAMLGANLGVSQNDMRAAAVPLNQEYKARLTITSLNSTTSPSELNSAPPTRFLLETQDTQASVLSPSRPLGSLVVITGNRLNSASGQSDILEFPIAPFSTDCVIQLEASGENLKTAIRPEADYTSPNQFNPVVIPVINKPDEKETLYCSVCHGSPNIGAMTKITHIEESSVDRQGDPASIVECNACHMKKHQQTTWPIRGVE